MFNKGWILLIILSLMIVSSGCGLLSDDSKKEADSVKKTEDKENSVAKIKFGDRSEDDKGLLNTRKHFGLEESFTFSVNFGQKINSTRLKIRIIKMPEGKVLQEMNEDGFDPSWKSTRWSFTNSSDFHGFYETGDYKMEILRGNDLLAEGEFVITD